MEFFDALVRYEIDLWNHLEARLRSSAGPGLASLEALRVIGRLSGSCRVKELREELRITVGAASKLADRLERDGLIDRHPNTEDHRSYFLLLTAVGDSALRRGAAVAEAALAEHVSAAAEDVAGLTAALGRLDDRVRDATAMTI